MTYRFPRLGKFASGQLLPRKKTYPETFLNRDSFALINSQILRCSAQISTYEGAPNTPDNMKLVSSLAWAPAGAAAEKPQRLRLGKEELASLLNADEAHASTTEADDTDTGEPSN